MFAGHFGLAAAVTGRAAPRVPLWALMLATQLLDIVFVPLLLTGVERMDAVPGKEGYGSSLIHADYTHSLVGALVLSALAAGLALRRWGRSGAWTVGAVVFSHWLLDLLVHRPDLPILPANWGDLPLLGFGLWRYPAICAVVEALLVAAGAFFYVRSLPKPHARRQRRSSLTAGIVMSVLLVASFASDLLGVG